MDHDEADFITVERKKHSVCNAGSIDSVSLLFKRAMCAYACVSHRAYVCTYIVHVYTHIHTHIRTVSRMRGDGFRIYKLCMRNIA